MKKSLALSPWIWPYSSLQHFWLQILSPWIHSDLIETRLTFPGNMSKMVAMAMLLCYHFIISRLSYCCYLLFCESVGGSWVPMVTDRDSTVKKKYQKLEIWPYLQLREIVYINGRSKNYKFQRHTHILFPQVFQYQWFKVIVCLHGTVYRWSTCKSDFEIKCSLVE